MAKNKLTLYMPEEINKLAHKRAKLSGKSISNLVKEFFVKEERKAKSVEIARDVQKWIGILKTDKSYKELRDEQIQSKLEKYENIS